MRTVHARAKIVPGGELRIRVPSDITPGEHQIVVVIDEVEQLPRPRSPLAFPVDDVGPWPEKLSLSREDLYDDRGR